MPIRRNKRTNAIRYVRTFAHVRQHLSIWVESPVWSITEEFVLRSLFVHSSFAPCPLLVRPSFLLRLLLIRCSFSTHWLLIKRPRRFARSNHRRSSTSPTRLLSEHSNMILRVSYLSRNSTRVLNESTEWEYDPSSIAYQPDNIQLTGLRYSWLSYLSVRSHHPDWPPGELACLVFRL